MSRVTPVLFALSALFATAFVVAPVRAGDTPVLGSPASAKPIDLQNATCPVKGTPITPGVTETVNGVVVHFCCTHCAAKYAANPAAYQSALRSDSAVALRLDEAGVAGHAMDAGSAPTASVKGAAFHDAMRKLWEDHVTWTRLFIVSALGNLADKDATTARLLKNQEDIGDAIKPIYGDDAGMKLTALLKDHILTAADLVAASAAGDSAKAAAATKKWSANADEIAAFLNGANPTAWPLDAAKAMMREHLEATTAEVAARIKKDWIADVAAFEKVHEQALKMADMLSDGIRSQFPQKFQ